MMMRIGRMFRFYILIFCALFISINYASAQTPICLDVDNFANSPNFNMLTLITNMDPGFNVTEDGSPGVLGDFRQVIFGPEIDGSGLCTLTINNSLDDSSSASSYCPLVLTYDDNGAGLNTNFNDGIDIYDRFEITVDGNDAENVTFRLTVSDSMGSQSFIIPELPNTIDGDMLPALVTIPFTNFPAIDFTDVQSIEFEPNSGGLDSGVDLLFTNFQACGQNFPPVMLDVMIQGSGDGGVESTNPGIDCSSTGDNDCDEIYNFGTMPTLTATPDPGSMFTGWSGDAACTGDPTNPVLNLTMNMDISCIATFDLIPVTLDVTIQGSGDGGVESTNPGIDCSSTGANDCDETYTSVTRVTLTATPEMGSMFTGWSGDAACTGDPLNPVLNLTMDMDISCEATFTPNPPRIVTLDVTILGDGDGGVVSTNPGIDCSSTGATDCDQTYFLSAAVTLTATPEPGSIFTGWSGDPSCNVDPQNPVLDLVLNMDISCIAIFDIIPPSPVTLDVAILGNGDGRVDSMNPGIACSSTGDNDCDELYSIGAMVTLTADPDPGSFFTGWSGDAACTTDPQNPILDLTMNMDISCIAIFEILPPNTVTLDVIIEGNGSCVVTSFPNVINCPGDCTEIFNPPGVTVDLTAIPDAFSTFVDWTGDCNDLNQATSITVNENSTCIATCIQSQFVLNPIFPALDDNINSISAENASSNGNVAFIWGQAPGSFTVGGRICNGVELGIANPRLLKIERANEFGLSTYIFYIPLFGDFEFAIQLQAVDIETCRVSNQIEQSIRKDDG